MKKDDPLLYRHNPIDQHTGREIARGKQPRFLLTEMLFNGPVQKEHETIKDLMTYLGWQMLFERISIEYAIGIGLRNASGSKYVATRTGNYTMNELVDGIANYKRTGPNFGISLKVGYHF